MLMLSTAVTHKETSSLGIRDFDSPTSRNSYQHLLVYADFESILKPADKEVGTTQGAEFGSESSYHVVQEHIQCSFAYKVVSSVDPNFSRPLIIKNAAEFVCDLQQEAKQLFDEYIPTPKPMLLTDRLTMLLLSYAQNCLEMIKYEIIVIL